MKSGLRKQKESLENLGHETTNLGAGSSNLSGRANQAIVLYAAFEQVAFAALLAGYHRSEIRFIFGPCEVRGPFSIPLRSNKIMAGLAHGRKTSHHSLQPKRLPDAL